MIRMRLSVYAVPLMLCGCAPYRYQSMPVSPHAQAVSLEARSLDDSALRSWMKDAAGFEPASWPLTNWDLQSLTLAGYYFNPDMDVARASAEEAAAAITTAAMKPNPSVSADGGYETALESPYLLGFDFSLPIETAGKRGYRIAEATHLTQATRLQVAETAWSVRTQVRAALMDLVLAGQRSSILRDEVSSQNRYVDLLQARFTAGEIPLPEITTARIGLTNLQQALRVAEGKVGTARAALAAAVGVPLTALDGKTVSWPALSQPPAPQNLPGKSIRAEAVENRLDVRRALAQYEAAQSRLQLEVARQYPDVNLGPGYAFEEGVHLLSVSAAAVLPLRNQNQGPIAEAAAQRKTAGAQLLATQSAVIAQTDQALAQYDAAYAVLQQARSSAAEFEGQRRTAYQWLKSGESDRLTAISADLEVAAAERAELDALRQAQIALGSLEYTLQRPVDSSNIPTLPDTAPRKKEF